MPSQVLIDPPDEYVSASTTVELVACLPLLITAAIFASIIFRGRHG